MKADRLASLCKFAQERDLTLECDYVGPVWASGPRESFIDIEYLLQTTDVDGKLHWEYFTARRDVVNLKRPRFITADGETLTRRQAEALPIVKV